MDIRVVVIDGHQLVREALTSLLQGAQGISVVGGAGDGLAAVQLVRAQRPDVVVLDVALPGLNGIEATRRIRGLGTDAKILCLSSFGDGSQVLAAMESGASAYLLKQCSFTELVQGIRLIAAGQSYLSPALIQAFVDSCRTRGAMTRHDSATLTPRERELVQLVSEGFSTQQIAQRLSISSKTVATHRENVLNKLNLTGIAQLTRYALRTGLSSMELTCAPAPQPAATPTTPRMVPPVQPLGLVRSRQLG
jgi:DNA-binding NarL/FixJ family response regulator